MTDTPKSPRRRIRYANGAGPSDDGDEAGVSSRAPWAESADNPMSSNYVPPQQRSPRGKARWWAMQERKKKKTLPVEFDIKSREW